MHSSSLIAPFLLAAGASGFVAGPSSRFLGAGVRPVTDRQRGTAVATMSSTVPPQLPDVNQNLSGGDFDK